MRDRTCQLEQWISDTVAEVRHLQYVGQEEATEEGVGVNVEAVEPLHVLLDAVRVIVPHVLVRHMAVVPVRASQIRSGPQHSHGGAAASSPTRRCNCKPDKQPVHQQTVYDGPQIAPEAGVSESYRVR